MSDINRKAAGTVVILLLIGLILVPPTRHILFEGHVFQIVDGTAEKYVDEGLVRAAAAFATARTFNAIVSVFQESQLQLEPGGVGVSLALGAALDPANDLVERFSWVMLASLTSLGVQKVLIEMTPFISVQIVFLLALLCLIAGWWLPLRAQGCFRALGRMLLFFAILLRFAVPTMAYLNQQVYTGFLAERHDLSVAALGRTVEILEEQQLDGLIDLQQDPTGQESGEEPNWWERTKTRVGQTVDQGKRMLDIKTRLNTIKYAALNVIDRIVDLIVVFVLSTVVLPLLFLWGFARLGRAIIDHGMHFPSGSPRDS